MVDPEAHFDPWEDEPVCGARSGLDPSSSWRIPCRSKYCRCWLNSPVSCGLAAARGALHASGDEQDAIGADSPIRACASTIAIRERVPILPVGIAGMANVLAPGMRLPRLRSPMAVYVGRPFDLAEYTIAA